MKNTECTNMKSVWVPCRLRLFLNDKNSLNIVHNI